MISGGTALIVALLGTPILIRTMIRRRIGQHIREDGPAHHSAKAGTPTMGGIALVGAVLAGYFVAHANPEVSFTRTGYLIMIAVGTFAVIGFLDDSLKVRNRRSLGLNKRAKF